MSSQSSKKAACFAVALCLVLGLAGSLAAQNKTGILRGKVTDPSGAVVPQAKVVVTTAAGQLSAMTGPDGTYEVRGVQAGKCRVQVIADGFTDYEKNDVQIVGGQVQTLDVPLSLQEQRLSVEVSSETAIVDVTPANNAGAVIIQGKDLDQLSDDPDELQADLEALAGPSAGPSGGQIYIDGFTAGQLPPKSSIREIRINQNPFSSEYDKLGYGRIEILTKPGTDKWHGQLEVQGNDSVFNSRNPFAATEPSYDSTLFTGSISGPINNKTSFFLGAQRRDIDNVNVVSASILDQNFNIVPFSDSVTNPRTRTNVNPRIDYQLAPNNTLTVSYLYYRDSQQNQGIGQFALASQGYNALSTENTVRASDTQVFGSKIVNETHFQYIHDDSSQTAQNTAPTISVLGAFTGGGNNTGNISDTMNRYELQNYTSMILGKHILKYGFRLREATDDYVSNSGFNGLFTFSSISSYQITEQGISENLSAAQIIANGGGATQYSITTGIPRTQVSMFDAGLYVQDDWRVRANVTLSLGLRFETQDRISDNADWAPRVAVAWGLGKKTVLRVGTGIFYDRFTESLLLQATRLNGFRQEQFVVHSPDFLPANAPAPGTIPAAEPTYYRIAPNLRAPGTVQTALTLERQLSKTAKLSVSYLNSRGFDQLLSNSINTPNPVTGIQPYGNVGNIYEFISQGIYRQNQLITNFSRTGAKYSLNAYYALSYANSDTAGATSFASNPYDLMADYGRASFAVRNRAYMGGSVALPRGFSLNPYMLVSSGQPFNITLGQDLIGSSIFNQRPAIASSLSNPKNIIVTPLGTFDMVPEPGETLVPVNYGSGPMQFVMNLRLSKTFGFGKPAENSGSSGQGGGRGPGGGMGRPGGGGPRPGGLGGFGGGGPFGRPPTQSRRYNLTFSINARNVLNKVNLAPPVGVITSPLFDHSNALAGGAFSQNASNRIIYLQMMFGF